MPGATGLCQNLKIADCRTVPGFANQATYIIDDNRYWPITGSLHYKVLA